MTTCLLVAALIACTNVAPLSPGEAAAVLRASVPAFVPPYAGTDHVRAVSYTPPRQAPVPAHVLPPTNSWTSVTTYVPRFGPPQTWFDGQAYRGAASRREGPGPRSQRRAR